MRMRLPERRMYCYQRFFGARSPSKLVYIGAQGAFRKNLGSVGKNGFIKKYQRGEPLGRQGVESLRGGGGGGVRPPAPL